MKETLKAILEELREFQKETLKLEEGSNQISHNFKIACQRIEVVLKLKYSTDDKKPYVKTGTSSIDTNLSDRLREEKPKPTIFSCVSCESLIQLPQVICDTCGTKHEAPKTGSIPDHVWVDGKWAHVPFHTNTPEPHVTHYTENEFGVSRH